MHITSERTSSRRRLRGSKILRSVTLLAAMSLVGSMGFVASSLMGGSNKAAAETVFKVSAAETPGVLLAGSVNGEIGGGYWAPLQRFIDPAGANINAYCADVTKVGAHTGDFVSGEWPQITLPKQDYIRWVVMNGYSGDLNKFRTLTGVSTAGTYEAIAATQAAIWYYQGFRLNESSPQAQYNPVAVNSANLVSAYQALIQKAQPVQDASLAIDKSKATMSATGLYGPLSVTVQGATSATIAASGSVQFVVNGQTVGTSTSVTSGQEFFIQATTSQITTTITANAALKISAGTALVPLASTNQPVIVSSTQSTATVQKTVSTQVVVNAAPSSLNLIKKAGSLAGPDANKNYIANYVINVVNTGSAPANYAQITDTPKFSAGTKIASVSWRGGPTQAASTPAAVSGDSYLIGAADQKLIQPGATHSYEVAVTFSVTAADQLSDCAATDPSKGLFNLAALSGETGQTTDNFACINSPKIGGQDSSLDLKKSAELNDLDGDGKADVGEAIIFRFLITNTGSQPISNVQVSDPMLKNVSVAITCPATALAAGASMTCQSAEYKVSLADMKIGIVKNIATVTGTDAANKTTQATAETSVAVDARAIIGLAMQATVADTNHNGHADLGEKISYTYKVTNSGNVALDSVTINDQMLSDAKITITCQQTHLEVGASTSCTAAPYTVTAADVSRGLVENSATASGDSSAGKAESAISKVTTLINTSQKVDETPGLTLQKKAQLNDQNKDGKANAGEQIVWSFILTNTTNVALKNVKINDPMLNSLRVAINCPATTIEPSVAMTCQASPYTVTTKDEANGSIKNVATASYNNGTLVTSIQSETSTPAGPAEKTAQINQPTALARTGADNSAGFALFFMVVGVAAMLKRRH